MGTDRQHRLQLPQHPELVVLQDVFILEQSRVEFCKEPLAVAYQDSRTFNQFERSGTFKRHGLTRRSRSRCTP